MCVYIYIYVEWDISNSTVSSAFREAPKTTASRHQSGIHNMIYDTLQHNLIIYYTLPYSYYDSYYYYYHYSYSTLNPKP